MLPDPPDGFSEKPFPDPGRDPDTAAAPAEADFPGRSMERYSRKIYEFVWNGPTGPLTVTVTDYADYFGTHHEIEIEIPPDTLFPLDDFSFPVGSSELARAGDARAFVERLLAIAERTDYWKDAAARARQGDLFGARPTLDPPRRPRRRRHVLRRPAPRQVIVSPLRDAIAGLITCKTSELSWNGPFGAVTLTVTDTKTYLQPPPCDRYCRPAGRAVPARDAFLHRHGDGD